MPQRAKPITMLAIETSCDETAAAVLSISNNRQWPRIKTLSSIIKSQIKIHQSFGGVVPEAAARAHVRYIRPVVQRALDDANVKLSDNQRFGLALPSPSRKSEKKEPKKALNAIDYIAVTVGPGLIPSLMVGVEFAKALSFATGKPIIPVNHMLGHLYSPFHPLLISPLKGEKIKKIPSPRRARGLGRSGIFPLISLIVSGGHTILVRMDNIKNYQVLGQTIDDAAGEAFDKVAKMLGLPYPGGPEVSNLAIKGDPHAIDFPRPMFSHKNYNFSFSGLKTAVLYYLRDNPLTAKSYPFDKLKAGKLKANLCASFQQAVVDVLVSKTLRAAKEFKAKSISLSGGVAANKALRDELKAKCQRLNAKLLVPALNLCTDNAEMIGLAAAFMLKNGFKPVNFKKVNADSNLGL